MTKIGLDSIPYEKSRNVILKGLSTKAMHDSKKKAGRIEMEKNL
jgi:hypothetical protein